MRRIIFAVALLTAATATAIDTHTHSIRIALLAPADRYIDRHDVQASEVIRDHVQRELRDLGYDAFITNDDRPRADYYVDILGPGGGTYSVASVGVPIGSNAGVDLTVLVGHVAASVNIYDGRTLEPLQTLDLHL